MRSGSTGSVGVVGVVGAPFAAAFGLTGDATASMAARARCSAVVARGSCCSPGDGRDHRPRLATDTSQENRPGSRQYQDGLLFPDHVPRGGGHDGYAAGEGKRIVRKEERYPSGARAVVSIRNDADVKSVDQNATLVHATGKLNVQRRDCIPPHDRDRMCQGRECGAGPEHGPQPLTSWPIQPEPRARATFLTADTVHSTTPLPPFIFFYGPAVHTRSYMAVLS